MMRRFGDGRDWFFERRFGLFLHWGIYAIPAWHEQHQYRLGLSRSEYAPLMRRFNPAHFDPDQWLDLAEAAGMQYVVFTTKHGDGFCLWNTAQTDYNVMHTPCGKDVLAVLAAACHRRGVPLCLYYSIVDMHQPNYPTAGRRYELPAPEPGDRPDLSRYMDYVKAQVRELCTNYGEIHGFWWDGNELKHRDPSLNEMIRRLQPKAVINNRGCDDGDFGTPEREWPEEGVQSPLRFTRPTEACNAMGVESWGYRRDEDLYSIRHLIGSIDAAMAKGGNYLLNAGPDADGRIDEEQAGLLRRIGSWYRQVRDAFDGAEPASELTDNRGVWLTRKGNSLYVHLGQPPISEAVDLSPLSVAPRRAVLLNTGQPVDARVEHTPQFWTHKPGYLRLRRLPVNEYPNDVLVVRLDFDRWTTKE